VEPERHRNLRGSLKDISPTQLGATVVAEALKRGRCRRGSRSRVFGPCHQYRAQGHVPCSVAALNGGVGQDTPCLTLNRLCGSGLQAIISAAQTILLGDADIALGVGPSACRGPYIMPPALGQRMGDMKAIDMMVGALHDPFDVIHMGVTAENVATKWGITRQEQDALAVESHRRAAAATKAGHFKSQIVRSSQGQEGAGRL